MVVYLTLLILTIVWLSLIALAPALKAMCAGSCFFADLYYHIFGMICHQQPERSFFLFGYQLPVCARCTGIYTGVFIGLVLYPVFNGINKSKIPDFKYLWPFFIPILIDGFFQTLHFYTTSNIFRFFTGILPTSASVFYIMPLLNEIYKREINKKSL